jgi:hypothetical protein
LLPSKLLDTRHVMFPDGVTNVDAAGQAWAVAGKAMQAAPAAVSAMWRQIMVMA